MPIHQNARQCTFIKVTGHQCGSPALKAESYCYFHCRIVKGVPTRPDMRTVPYAVLENAAAIQVAVMEVVSAIIEGRMDYRKASLVMKGLQLAASLCKQVHFGMSPELMVTELPNYAQEFLDEHPEYEPARTAAPNKDAASHPSPSAPEAVAADPHIHPDTPVAPSPKKPCDAERVRQPELNDSKAADGATPVARNSLDESPSPANLPLNSPASQSTIANWQSKISLAAGSAPPPKPRL